MCHGADFDGEIQIPCLIIYNIYNIFFQRDWDWDYDHDAWTLLGGWHDLNANATLLEY